MASSTAGRGTPPAQPGAGSTPFGVEPVEITRVVVPLDGSPFAERALTVATWAGSAVGAGVHLVEVVRTAEDAEGAVRYLDEVARRHGATSWDTVEHEDVAAALGEAIAARPGSTACMATHGRDRTSALLGSVAASLLDRTPDPTLLVGPVARPVTAADAPIVVAVDGTVHDDVLMPVALGWAVRLARRLIVVTVAVPASPQQGEQAAPAGTHGPADPEPYVAALAQRAAGAGVDVDTLVARDAFNVRDGIVPVLDRTAALVVIGSRRRHGRSRVTLGPHASRVVHDTAVPALAVPVEEA